MAKSVEELTDLIIETDYLVVGGGLVGGMSAIRAKKNNPNMDVTVIDKAKMEWSGDGVGLDNFNGMPKSRAELTKEFTEDDAKGAIFGAKRLQGLSQISLSVEQMKNPFIYLPILEELGVRVKEDDGTLMVLQAYRRGTNWGRLEYDDDGKPSEPLFGSFSRGTDLKMRMGATVRKYGVRVLDRTMLTSIVTRDGVAVGATAINVRTNAFVFIKAKAVLLATGGASRLYPYMNSPYPNNLFYTITSPVNHGGGHVAALQAGAKVFSMELGNFYNVSKGMNHSSGGGGCNWYFRMYNSKGEALEDKYADRVVTKAGGMIPGLNYLFAPDMKNAEVLNDVILSYKDVADPDTIAAVYFTAATEPLKALKFHKLAGGLTNELPVECNFISTGIGMAGANGVLRENTHAETGVKNMFAAGLVVGGGTGFTWSCKIADYVTELVKDKQQAKIDAEQLKQIEDTKQWVFAPLGRRTDYTVDPMELEDYVKHVNHNYVGVHKYTSKMQRGLELIQRAKEGSVPLLSANSPHELMRAIEVQQIIEISEMHIQSSIMRDESRIVPVHYRVEFPEKNDDKWYGKFITVKYEAGKKVYAIETLD